MSITTPTRVLTLAAAVVATSFALAAAGVPAQAATAIPQAIPHFKAPDPYGTEFQPDPHQDFSKHISSRHDGILRGRVTFYRKGMAEYVPIRWKKGGPDDGHFVSPPKGDAMAYASPIAAKAVLYSVSGTCAPSGGGAEPSVDKRGLGTKKCSAKALKARLTAGYRAPSLITVYKGKIWKIQEIYTP